MTAADFTVRCTEAEFAFEMAEDVPAGPTYTAESIKEFIGTALPSIEIVDHRYHNWQVVGAPSLLADNAIHGAWVVGEPYAGWREIDFATHPVALTINGQRTLTGTGAAVLGNPLTVVAWLANELPRFGRRFRRGDRITTGRHDRHLPGAARGPADRRLRQTRPRRDGVRVKLNSRAASVFTPPTRRSILYRNPSVGIRLATGSPTGDSPMLPSLLVAAAVTAPAAPIPRDTLPNTTGPAPRVLAVKADTSGTVWVTGQIYQKRKIKQNIMVIENGKQVMKQQEREVMTSSYLHKTLGDFGGKFVTADGTPITTDEATKRAKDGAVILISADGKPIDKSWLKAVRPDTVVMLAEGLGNIVFQYGAAPMPMTADPRLVMLCTNDQGAVRLPVNPNGGNANGNQIYYENLGGGRVIRGQVMVQSIDISGSSAPGQAQATKPAGSDGKKALEDIKFEAYDLNGKLIPKAVALKRLKAGGLALVAGDNRFPDANYFKAFRGELIVLVSPELVFPAGTPNPFDVQTKSTAPAPTAPVQAPAIQIKPAILKRAAAAPPPP